MISRQNSQRLGKLLLTTAFSALSLAAGIAGITPGAQGYEISIYPAYPLFFWTMLVLSVSASILTLFLAAASQGALRRMILAAMLSVLASNSFLILLPSFRGYNLGFGPTWDVMFHIGEMKHLLVRGSISEGNFYPMIHLLGAMMSQTTSLAPESSATILPVVFYLLFMLSLLLMAKSVGRGSAAEAVTIALATPLLFSLYTRALQPSLMALFFFPLMLYLWHKRERNIALGSRISVLLILCAFFLTFFHPLTVLLTTSVFLVFAVSRALTNRPGPSKGRLRKTSQSRTAPAVHIALIMMVTFLTWYLSFSAILGNLKQVALSIAGEGGTPLAQQQFQLFTSADLTLTQVAYIGINLYGPVGIYLALATACCASLAWRRKARSEDYREVTYGYGLQFVVSLLLAGFLLATFSILGDVVRLLAFPLFFSIVLGGLFFPTMYHSPETFLDRHQQRTRRNRAVLSAATVVVVALLLISGGLGIMNLYGSSRTLQPNQEVTSTDLSGFNWFFAHAPFHTNVFSNLRVDRFADLLFCPYQAECPNWVTTPIPPHFSYNTNTSMGKLMESQHGTLITTRLDELSYLAYPSDLQPLLQSRNAYVYLGSDFQRLAEDPLLSKAYDNGGFAIWTAAGW